MPVPIIDLFAGPGGLGEGFAALQDDDGSPFFQIGLSIEKTKVAHRTLTLRAVYRRLRDTSDVLHYYRFIRGEIDEAAFRTIPAVAEAYRHADREARCLELGKSDEAEIDVDIRQALKGEKNWVLIGGPPCQAYSLAGRSRRIHDKDFYRDEKHFLYREYLRIIRVHRPAIFVMENVKGLLSSRHSGGSMFEMILGDLAAPEEGLEYEIRSFVKAGNSDSLEPADFVIQSERFGVPQGRHRVILLGVRKGLRLEQQDLLRPVRQMVTVKEAIGDLPRIRSKLSRADSLDAWQSEVSASVAVAGASSAGERQKVLDAMSRAARSAVSVLTAGGAFMHREGRKPAARTELMKWLLDPELGGVCQHQARSHMASDLARYLFAASYAKCRGISPTLKEFPSSLLPQHKSVKKPGTIPFNDRFRVQCADQPSSTVVAHIAKDGHYYIHYDPCQCRSLTVREAARLQTFPDNYFFMGNRTEQYTQVGNAVPPFLARKLAVIVQGMLKRLSNRKN